MQYLMESNQKSTEYGGEDNPLNIRNDCKLGQWKINDEILLGNKLKMAIVAIERLWGSLGRSGEQFWLQVFFFPQDHQSLPNNHICVTYCKTQSADSLAQIMLYTSLTEKIEIAKGITETTFLKHSGEYGDYFSVDWKWRTRAKGKETIELKKIQKWYDALKENRLNLIDPNNRLIVPGCLDREVEEELVIEPGPGTSPNHSLAPAAEFI